MLASPHGLNFGPTDLLPVAALTVSSQGPGSLCYTDHLQKRLKTHLKHTSANPRMSNTTSLYSYDLLLLVSL